MLTLHFPLYQGLKTEQDDGLKDVVFYIFFLPYEDTIHISGTLCLQYYTSNISSASDNTT